MDQTFSLKNTVNVSMSRIRIKNLQGKINEPNLKLKIYFKFYKYPFSEYHKCNYETVKSLYSTFPNIPSNWYLKVYTEPLIQSLFNSALTVKIPYELTIRNNEQLINSKRFFKVEMMFDDRIKGSLQESFNFKLSKTCYGSRYTQINQILKLRGVFSFQKDSYIKGGDFVLCVRVTAKDVIEVFSV